MAQTVRGVVAKGKGQPVSIEEITIPDRGHSLTIDSGWRTVADEALAFVQRFVE